MAELFKGAPVAAALIEDLRARAEALVARGVVPTLAILRAGERGDDLTYERAALRRCEACGVAARVIALPADVTRERLLDELAALNADARVHGVLPMRPLPFDGEVCAALAPEKDVDGVTPASMAALYAGTGAAFAPCTAEACVALLKHYGVPLAGRRAVVIGRSLVIGRPLALLLLAENATVTLAHSRTEDLPALCREADVLAVAAGRAGLVGAEHLRPGQTVVDVGVNVLPDGTLAGDVRADEAARAAAVTPVPGGVGAVTTAVLCAHVIRAAERQTK